MNYRFSLKHFMLPALEKAGFSFSVIGKNDFCFKNKIGTRQILVDTGRFYPHALRIAYQVTGQCYFRFMLNEIDPQFFPVANETYRTEEDLAEYLQKVARGTVQIILPYLDIMEENYIEYDDSLSLQMAFDIQARIKRFREKWKIDLLHDPVCLKKLDTIMDTMRTTISNRKADFKRHQEEFLDLTAFYGELLNAESETAGMWTWREVDPGHPEYVVGPTRYNPLRRTILAWNFGPEVAQYSLQGYHLKVEVNQG